MRNPIARLLGRALLPVLLGLLVLTLPPTGRHRPRTVTHRRHRRPRPASPAPTRRSPYAQERTALLDGARSPLERPYLTARAQRRRRRALWLATVGVDVDHRNIHAGSAR
ncbi:hypothetical protein M5362_24915 [Streptomyces sp. Je 1-79]|uniref:hypothetical protein n=1 Tax=Streptomyces sp. Je 1-79 TaxID=2943847 RepID=UPI0021A3F42D|nr:hypothetical protein [Streptomyces sp. Je 1-79]MCT4356373.1 hypothetical protein [Streptomyces sp. Je 1-79]